MNFEPDFVTQHEEICNLNIYDSMTTCDHVIKSPRTAK